MIVRVERRAGPEPCDQIGIGEEGAAEGDGVGLAGFERGLGAGEIVIRIEHQRALEGLADMGVDRRHLGLAEGAVGRRLAQLEEGDADLRERGSRGREQSERVAVVDALQIAVGREAHRGPFRADRVGDGLRHLAEQAHPILDRAAIIVVAQVGPVAQELVDQIAIGAVDLDAVEAGPRSPWRRHRHNRRADRGFRRA